MVGLHPMISPFSERTPHVESGLTGGLSVCGYDLHVKDGVVLWPGDFQLAVTVERLSLPRDVVGILHDKSTLARLGLAVQNTVAEPGWSGWLTLELSNHSKHKIVVKAGQPIGQMMFHRLDYPSQGYDGRYQNQGSEPQPALFLKDERPANCRDRLRDEGKAYPRSGCAVCGTGGMLGCPHE